MLQPTQVDRVIPTCLGVLARFPTLHVDSTHLEEITAAGLHAEVKAGMIRLPEERASRGRPPPVPAAGLIPEPPT